MSLESLSIHLGFSAPAVADNNDPAVVKTVDSLADAVPSSSSDNGGASERSIIIYLSPQATYGMMDLSAFSKHLKPGATVKIHIAAAAAADDSENTPAATTKLPSLQDVHNSILLAGLRSTSEARHDDGSRILTATKQAPLSTTSLAAAPIRIDLKDDVVGDDDDDDLVDEDGLLNDSTLLAAPPAMSAVASKTATDDCAGREPCADCTCGRADAKKTGGGGADTAAATSADGKVKTSSCGKCGLGDAFRCASCPYLGKPAFKPGEEHLVLDLQDDL